MASVSIQQATKRFGEVTAVAFAVALLWVVHPLHTDALNHVVYRNGTMMAAGYLASLYCALRAFSSPRPRRWGVLCVLAALLAMTAKEVAVSLPLGVLAFDRFFGAGSFRGALRARPGMYAGLAASWVVLALCVLGGDRDRGLPGSGETGQPDGHPPLAKERLPLLPRDLAGRQFGPTAGNGRGEDHFEQHQEQGNHSEPEEDLRPERPVRG